jgi:uncharacterized protein (DUF1499 family)
MSYLHYQEKKNYWLLLSNIVTFISLFLLLIAVLGYRFELFSIKYSLLILTKYAVYSSIISLGFNLITFGNILSKKLKASSILVVLLSFIINITIVTSFYDNIIALKSNPKINDVSTNYEDSIDFKISKNHLIKNNEYSLIQKYGGYDQPNYKISSLLINNKTHKEVFNVSKNIIIDMGLNITYSNLEEGFIEAVDKSFWYGFEDDIIIRIEKLISDDIKVDARSASRKGRSDFGINSKRITNFLKKLNKKLYN